MNLNNLRNPIWYVAKHALNFLLGEKEMPKAPLLCHPKAVQATLSHGHRIQMDFLLSTGFQNLKF